VHFFNVCHISKVVMLQLVHVIVRAAVELLEDQIGLHSQRVQGPQLEYMEPEIQALVYPEQTAQYVTFEDFL
jgi:hypothetical protein